MTPTGVEASTEGPTISTVPLTISVTKAVVVAVVVASEAAMTILERALPNILALMVC